MPPGGPDDTTVTQADPPTFQHSTSTHPPVSETDDGPSTFPPSGETGATTSHSKPSQQRSVIFTKVSEWNRESCADMTALPMNEKRVTTFDLMKIDEEEQIIEFAEKPKGEQLKAMQVQAYLYDGS
ncbi:hypothetical protein ZIOFF_016483 [Zingiber officinale]|uniref:Nucleotidyl transferase domain-containing protein n=1 Tax=Zingiber officinale TaxID=94328 RepID=A0A8J5LH77_ZINOF|nr:hypothetical protein ZIOFF_016483 [Zingiber officinale]